MSKIHFVVLEVNEENSIPEFGILLVENDGTNKFFTLYKGEPLEIGSHQIKNIRYVGKREFGESGPLPDNDLESFSLQEFLNSSLFGIRNISALEVFKK